MSESDLFDAVINEEIDKGIYRHKQYQALKRMCGTLRHLELLDLTGIRMTRFESDEQWVNHGCPDADYILQISFNVDGETQWVEYLL